MTPSGLAGGLLVVLSMVAAHATTSFAQSGGPYDLRGSTIDGGGSTSATGGIYALGGTIGQADAGRVAGGSVVVNGGFWKPLEAMSPTATVTRTTLPTLSAIPTATGTAVPSTTATKLPATPTPTLVVGNTPTAAVAVSPSPTRSPVPTATRTPTTVAGNTPTATVTAAPSASPSATVPPTPTPTPSPTPILAGTRGDANCDGRLSAADMPTLIRNVITGERAACGLDDVNGDTRVDNSDIQLLIDALFGEL